MANESGSWLRVAHVVVGVAGLLAFAETGRHMDMNLGHLATLADAPRALYRSAHIYILLCSLLHFVLGLYLQRSSWLPGRLLQWLGSTLLFAALAGFLFGFYIETPAAEIERPVIRLSIYWCLAGGLVHGVERFVALMRSAESETRTDT